VSTISAVEQLHTKLYIPAPRPDVIARPRLTAQLDEGAARPLTLVCASAGYGKTTLVSQWLSQQHAPAAWLSLDKQDNDPARFWAYVVAALQSVRPQLGQAALAALHSPQAPPLMSVLPGLLEQIGRLRTQLILVLDDYQFIGERAIHETLTFFLDHLPTQMHLVIVTRADPPLPLARLRARNQMVELRAQDLRFTTAEAEAFFDRVAGMSLSAEDVAALDARTEGWIVGLQLAALSMKGIGDATGFVKAFTGSHVYVAEYLVEEVLQQLPEQTQMFLLQTSILGRLNAALCAAVTGREDAQATLAALYKANLFLIPLDSKGQWFRYHHLFADLLINRLRQTLPANAIQELHCRAGAWFAQHDLLDEAIQHALAGKDYEGAVSLVTRVARAMMFSGEVNTLLRWLAALPEESYQRHPSLGVYRTWIDLLQGRIDLSEQALQAKEEMLNVLPPSPENDALRAELMAILCRFVALAGNTARAIRFAQETLKYLSPGDLALRARADSALALAYGMEGRAEQAERAYRACLSESQASGNYSLAAHTTMLVAQGMQQYYGRLHEAAARFQSIVDMGAQAGQAVFFPAGQGYVGLASVHLEWNDLDIAEDYLNQGIELCRQGGLDGVFMGCTIKSRLRQAKGDLAGAQEEMHRLEQAFPRAALSHVALDRWVRLGLAMGDIESVSRWVTPLTGMLKAGQTAALFPSLVLDSIKTTLARVYVAQGDLEQATHLLDELQATAGPGRRFGCMIEVHLLRAQVLQGQEQGPVLPAARECLSQALELAEPEGYVTLFREEGPWIIPGLNALLRHPAMSDRLKQYARRLLDVFPASDTQAALGPVADLVEPLTARELEVLRLIAAGDSNQVIAAKLVITVSAVKKHASNIFGKLNVNSRTQAVARARRLGLLAPGG
jgi:LuxR family maltose regulon positive regulatory protein